MLIEMYKYIFELRKENNIILSKYDELETLLAITEADKYDLQVKCDEYKTKIEKIRDTLYKITKLSDKISPLITRIRERNNMNDNINYNESNPLYFRSTNNNQNINSPLNNNYIPSIFQSNRRTRNMQLLNDNSPIQSPIQSPIIYNNENNNDQPSPILFRVNNRSNFTRSNNNDSSLISVESYSSSSSSDSLDIKIDDIINNN